MQKAEIEVVAKTQKAEKAIKSLEKTLDSLADSQMKNREGFEVLDTVSGGYAGKIKDLAGSVRGAIKGAKGFAKSLKGVKAALISTGVGAIVVALGLIVAYWDDIKGLVSGVSSEQQDLLQSQKDQVAEMEKQSQITSSMENTLRLQGKSEKEIRDLKRQQLNDTISALEAQLITQQEMKKNQVEAAERNQNIAKGIIGFLSTPLLIITGLIDGITNSLKNLGIIEEATSLTEDYLESTSSMLFDPEEVAEEGEKTIEETQNQLRKLKNTRDGFILKDKADRKKQSEDDKKDEEDKAKEKAEALEKIRQGEIDTEDEKRAEELRKVQEHYAELIRLADLYGQDTTELKAAQKAAEDELQAKYDAQDLAKLEAEQQKIIEDLELSKEFDAMNFEDQRALLNEREAQVLADETLSEEQKTAMLASFADARKTIVEKENEAKTASAQSYAGGLSKVSGLIGKETQGGKMAASAAALIQTYLAAQQARTSQLAIPTPDAPVRAALAMGVEIAAGLKNVKEINTIKVPKASGGGGASVSKPATTAPPSFNIIGATETSQLADSVAGQMNEPVQAYVVAQDVTTAQSLENGIIEGASI